MPNRSLIATAISAICLSLSLPALASAQDDLLPKELVTYQLTVANATKVKAVLDEFDRRALGQGPELDDENLDASIRRFEKDPVVAGILKANAISASDFIKTLTVITSVSLAMGLTGDTSGASLPPALRAHGRFIANHKKELEPLLKLLFEGNR